MVRSLRPGRRRNPRQQAFWAVVAVIAAILVSVFAGALHAAEREGVNPCDFSGFDAPCKVSNGEYRAWKPKGEGPFPALVYLYGSLGRADMMYRSEYFRRSVTGRGYVLIVPEALAVVNYVGGITDTGWSRAARRNEHPRDDIAFLRAVLDHAETRFRIDRRRVLIAGQSDGGFLIWEMACHQSRIATAYAVHAGSYGGQTPARCDSPVRLLHAHGRFDSVVPFEAERVRRGRGVTAANPLDALAVLAASNGCRGRAEARVDEHRGFRRTTWSGCRPGAAVEYWVHGGGHSYPGQWLPMAIDWFEGFDLAPPSVGQRVVRRPGKGDGARATGEVRSGRFTGAQQGGSRFKSVPD
ncbi:MAG: hypothetical protein AAFR52_16375 [Pseudomonadota bacterium]